MAFRNILVIKKYSLYTEMDNKNNKIAKKLINLGVTEPEDKVISELANTKAVKEMARIVKDRFSEDDISRLIATYLFFNAKGREEMALNYFTHDYFKPLLRIGVTGFLDLLPELITDPHFFKIMISLYGSRLDLKKLFK